VYQNALSRFSYRRFHTTVDLIEIYAIALATDKRVEGGDVAISEYSRERDETAGFDEPDEPASGYW
jgi:hypothetical protein